MAVEIERKFLVRGEAWRAAADRTERMVQGYLNDHDAIASGRQMCSVRLRIAGPVAFLNLKSRETGLRRLEFEYVIPMADAESLLALCSGGRIDKVRHYVRCGEHLWEIDEFLGDNAGLIVAEVELEAIEEDFVRPDWLGAEVTDEVRYYNLSLTGRPYRSWTEEERNPCS